MAEAKLLLLELRSCVKVEVAVQGSQSLSVLMISVAVKPVLNWANVCSPNILRTVRRTTVRQFLIELLLRRTLV